jgi:4-hydroxy-3-methylbut-2-enyl diphosphate reductase
VIVATEVRHRGSTLAVDAGVAERLRHLGARTGPIVTVDRIAGPRERAALGDALAVDLESFWVEPQAVVRVVVDEPGRRLLHPGTLVAGVRALRTLRRVGRAIRSR